MTQLQHIIEKAWENRSLLTQKETIDSIRKVIDLQCVKRDFPELIEFWFMGPPPVYRGCLWSG